MIKNKNMFEQKHNKPRKTSFKAIIFNGNFNPDIANIQKYEKTFTHKGKSYNFDFEQVIYFVRKGIFTNIYYLFYYIDNPEPLKLDKGKLVPKYINSQVYDSILKSKLISQINEHNVKGNMFANIKLEYILIIIGVIVVGIYFMMGGSL